LPYVTNCGLLTIHPGVTKLFQNSRRSRRAQHGHLPKDVVSIGLISTGSNAIAASALGAVTHFGYTNVAVWPDDAVFLNAQGMPQGATWYSALADFMSRYPASRGEVSRRFELTGQRFVASRWRGDVVTDEEAVDAVRKNTRWP
jgi:hypothetical protein